MSGDQGEPRSVEDAVVTLQSTSSTASNRLNALRYLRVCLTSQDENARKKREADRPLFSKINRLVMDNVMRMVLSEDGIEDVRQKQYIRAECLLHLSQILEAPNVFDDARRRMDDISTIADENDAGSVASSSHASSFKRRSDLRYTRDKNRPMSPLSLGSSGELLLKKD